MLRALVCACLLAIRIHASGPEGLPPKGSLLAPSSEQHGASFLLESDKDESSRVPELATLPPKPTDEHNTGSRAGPSASFGHPLARVPVPLELPTVVPPPLSPRRRNPSRTREPRNARADRHRGRRSSSDRPKPSRRNRDRLNSVALVTIAVHQESHRRGRHSSRRHNRQSCTVRVNEKNGNITVDIYGNSPRGRGRDGDRSSVDRDTSRSPHRRSYSPRGRDGDYSPRRDYSPVDRDNSRSPRGRNRSPVDRDDYPIGRDRSIRRRRHSPPGGDRSPVRRDYTSPDRNNSPPGRRYYRVESYGDRRPSSVRPQSPHSPGRDYEVISPQPLDKDAFPKTDFGTRSSLPGNLGVGYSSFDHGNGPNDSTTIRPPSPVRPQRDDSQIRRGGWLSDKSPPSPVGSRDSYSSARRRRHRADRPRQFDVGAFRKANLLKAIDEEDLGTIKELYRSSDSRKEITDHVVEAKSSEFILKFAEIIEFGKGYLFSSLFRKKSNAAIEQVLEKSDFSQEDLIDAARDVELVCLPQRFVHLLSKIESMKSKVKVIVDGVIQLFTKERTECIEPLLTELESKQFLSKDLANFATQVIFVAGVFEDNEICTKSLYDRPAITSEVYAYALSVTAHKAVKSPLSGWLLAAASRDDLLALKKWGNHGALNTEFQKASDTVKHGESRHCAIVGPIVEAVNEVTSGLVPEPVAGIICSYVTENEGSSKSKRKQRGEHQYMLESIMERIQSDDQRRLLQTIAQDQSQGLGSRRRRDRRRSYELEHWEDQGRQEANEDYYIVPPHARLIMTRTRDAENVVEERVVEQPQPQAIQQLPGTVQTEEVAQVQAVGEGLTLTQEQPQPARQSRRSKKKGGKGKKSKAKTGTKTMTK